MIEIMVSYESVKTRALDVGDKHVFRIERVAIVDIGEQQQLGLDLVGLADEHVGEKAEHVGGHVETGRVGEVGVEIVERAGGLEPVGELLVECLGRRLAIATDRRQLSEQRGAVEQHGGLLELNRFLGRLDAVQRVVPREVHLFALRVLKKPTLD